MKNKLVLLCICSLLSSGAVTSAAEVVMTPETSLVRGSGSITPATLGLDAHTEEQYLAYLMQYSIVLRQMDANTNPEVLKAWEKISPNIRNDKERIYSLTRNIEKALEAAKYPGFKDFFKDVILYVNLSILISGLTQQITPQTTKTAENLMERGPEYFQKNAKITQQLEDLLEGTNL